MPIYKITNSTLTLIKERPFQLEREIQLLFEKNLSTIMNLEFVRSEFAIKNKRIDTLAYDPQTKSFVIIEYKRSKNISVIDQGFTYLGLMLENKDSFVLEYNESLNKLLKRKEVDWSQSRVVFVATGFTENQKMASNFKDIAIELWEVKQFENGTIHINPIKKTTSAESIRPLTSRNQVLEAVQKEIKIYTEEDHLQKPIEAIKELYELLKERTLAMADDIELVPQKMYIAFRKEGRNFVYFHLQQKNLKIWLNAKQGQLQDPKQLTTDVSSKGHYGHGDYEVNLTEEKHIDYVMSLFRDVLQL